MEIRRGQPTGIKIWERDRLFVTEITEVTGDGGGRLLPMCGLGATHDTDNLRGMMAVRVGFVVSTLNALYALVGI